MKLISTEFGENSIELLYADNPDTDAASTLLVVRLPKTPDPKKSLAWNRFFALSDLHEKVRELANIEREISEGIR